MGVSRSFFFFYLHVFSKLSTMNDFANRKAFAKTTQKWESLLILILCSLFARQTQFFQSGSLWGETIP